MQRGSPYPIELRNRVIELWRRGDKTWEELADLFGIGRATVNRWVGRYQRTGSVAPSPHGGGQTLRIADADLPKLRTIVEVAPDGTRSELAEALCEKTGRLVSVATIGRALRRLGFTRKKRLWSRVSATDRRSSQLVEPSSKRSAASRRAGSSISTRPARTSR